MSHRTNKNSESQKFELPEALTERLGGDNNVPRLLSREESSDLIDRVSKMAQPDGATSVSVTSWWNGELRWARNRVSLSSDRRDVAILVWRLKKYGMGYAITNQLDDVSLKAAMKSAERLADRHVQPTPEDMTPDPIFLKPPTPTIWSNNTFDASLDSRSQLSQQLTKDAEENEMLSAGYLEVRGVSFATSGNTLIGNSGDRGMMPEGSTGGLPTSIKDNFVFGSLTQAQCSMTVRHPKGTGSGWAGLSSYDWAKIDSLSLANRALDKCLKSLNPVRIEPGRYTVILEPQAVCDLVDLMMAGVARAEDRTATESQGGPFALGADNALKLLRTKLGLKVVDERITISHDPMDPLLGVFPELGLAPITWIEHGILRTMTYDRRYSLYGLNENLPQLYRQSYRMSGGQTTIEEMISGTKRGLLVTRFSNLRPLDRMSILSTGVTRDGLWLIENGKISKSVNNMRITESPLFVLNQVEQLGVPVPVFRAVRDPIGGGLSPAIVPPIKANDFSFTSTIDAV